MMTSNPSYILIKPETLNVINKIIDFRETTKIPICFTLDAGPNLVYYIRKFFKQVLDFINYELINYCKNRKFILDKVGQGAKNIILQYNEGAFIFCKNFTFWRVWNN